MEGWGIRTWHSPYRALHVPPRPHSQHGCPCYPGCFQNLSSSLPLHHLTRHPGEGGSSGEGLPASTAKMRDTYAVQAHAHSWTGSETFNTCTLLHTVQQSLADESASDLSRLTAQSLWEFHFKLHIEVAPHLRMLVHWHPIVCHPSDHTYVRTYIRTHPSPPLAPRARNKASMTYVHL